MIGYLGAGAPPAVPAPVRPCRWCPIDLMGQCYVGAAAFSTAPAGHSTPGAGPTGTAAAG